MKGSMSSPERRSGPAARVKSEQLLQVFVQGRSVAGETETEIVFAPQLSLIAANLVAKPGAER
jgi:hypothetical protein